MKSRTSKKSRGSHRDPYAWLGVGALTLGMGAALAGGTGVASADSTADSQTSSASSSSTSSAANGAARSAARRTGTHGAAAKPSGATAHPTTPTVNTSAPLPAVHSKAVSARASLLAGEASATRTAVPSALARRGDAPAPSLQYASVTYAPTPAELGPVLGAVRWAINELQYQALGLTPVAKANQLPSIGSQTAVAGTLNTVGPFGNPVAFTITGQPSNGAVSVDANGFYVYKPDAELAANGGTDTFTVTATDTAFHLENLLGQSGHSTAITVPVTVAAQAGQNTTAYYVTNTSYQPVQVAAYTVNEATLSPAVGSVLETGQSALFEIANGKNVAVQFNPVGVSHEGVVQAFQVSGLPFDVAPTPDGKLVYVTSSDNTVSVIDTASGLIAATIQGFSNPEGVAVSPDGKRAYVANTDANSVSVIDTAKNVISRTISVGTMPKDIAISPDGALAYVTNFGSDTVSVIDTATDTVTDTILTYAYPSGIATSPDGTRIYVANFGADSLSVIERITPLATKPFYTNLNPINVGHLPRGVAVGPDGTHVYVTNGGSNTVSVIDTATRTVTDNIAVATPGMAAVSPDGERLYVTTSADSGTVSTIATATNTVIETIPVGYRPNGIALSPTGAYGYVPTSDYHYQPSFGGSVAVIGVVTNGVGDGGVAAYTVTMSGGTATCSSKGGACGVADTTTYLEDAPGTVYFVPADQAQQQSNVLQELVYDDLSNATFYTNGASTIGYTNPMVPQNYTVYSNYTSSPSTSSWSIATTTSRTDSTSFNTTVKAGFKFKIYELEVSAEQSWSETSGLSTTDTHSYTQTVIQTVQPGETLYLYTVTPVLRFYGNWTVLYGNTTYELTDVWFDTPYTGSGVGWNPQLAAYTCYSGSEQCAQLAAGDLSGLQPLAPPKTPTYPVAESNSDSSYNSSYNSSAQVQNP